MQQIKIGREKGGKLLREAENQAQTEPSPIQKDKGPAIVFDMPTKSHYEPPHRVCRRRRRPQATPRIQISARFCLVLSNALQPSGELEFESQFDTM